MLQVMADNALKPLWMVGLLLTTNMWCVLLIFGVFFFLMVDVQFVASNEHKMMKDDRNGAWN